MKSSALIFFDQDRLPMTLPAMNGILEVLGPLVATVAHADAGSLDSETDLLATGLLDSLQVVHLAGEIERVFGLRLDAYDLTPENFASLSNLATLIEAKLLLSKRN